MRVPPYSALVDDATKVLLTLSQQVPIIVFLAKNGLGEHIPLVQQPNYIFRFEIADESYDTFTSWTWDSGERRFTPSPLQVVTDELRQRSLLCVKKSHALYEFAQTIATARYPTWSGMVMQDVIYAAKLREARDYRAAPNGHY